MLLWCAMAEESADTAEYQAKARRRAALEEDLLRMAQGDTAALERFYEGTKAVVYGFVLSILKHAHDAEDVMQEVYLQIYSAAGRYRPDGNPMPWILTIAKNLALMKLRQRRRESQMTAEEAEAFLDSVAWESGVSREDSIVLRSLLLTLSAEELQIVMLHAVAGCKHREIAAMLELPLPTVLSKYRRALKKLKNQWEEGHE